MWHVSSCTNRAVRLAAAVAVAHEAELTSPELRGLPARQRRAPLLNGELDEEIARCLLIGLGENKHGCYCLRLLDGLTGSLVTYLLLACVDLFVAVLV